MTAYQLLHRTAKVKRGETVLVHGAAGRVGTAVLELGAVAGLRMYGCRTNEAPMQQVVLTLIGGGDLALATLLLVAVVSRREPAAALPPRTIRLRLYAISPFVVGVGLARCQALRVAGSDRWCVGRQ